MQIKNMLLGAAAGVLAIGAVATGVMAANTTVVVTPGDLATSPADVLADPTKWFFYNDETDAIDNTLGSVS